MKSLIKLSIIALITTAFIGCGSSGHSISNDGTQATPTPPTTTPSSTPTVTPSSTPSSTPSVDTNSSNTTNPSPPYNDDDILPSFS